jgi:hypothetical protein
MPNQKTLKSIKQLENAVYKIVYSVYIYKTNKIKNTKINLKIRHNFLVYSMGTNRFGSIVCTVPNRI